MIFVEHSEKSDSEVAVQFGRLSSSISFFEDKS